MPSPYPSLNRLWKAVCTAVLGREVGELREYEGWLTELNDKFFSRKSSVSGKEVVFGTDAYCKGAKAVSCDEVDFMRRFEPLSINDMKDIDSLVQAVSERANYCGNILLGNSKFVERSSSVTDSVFVYRSVKVSGSKNIAYSQYLRLCENLFGTNEAGSSSFCIKGSAHYFNTRSLELWISCNTSDCYYSYGLDDCRDCMFSFNLVGKARAIGNLVLQKDKHASIKKKLLEDMASELESKRRLPSLMEIVSRCENPSAEMAALVKGKAHEPSDKQDMAQIEKDFAETSGVVLGRPLSGIDKYAKWLSRTNAVPYPASSAFSKARLQLADYPCIRSLPKDRLVTQEEALALGEMASISEAEAGKISLGNAHEFLSRIAYFPPERRIGRYRNLIDCSWGTSAFDSYKVIVAALCKHCAYSTWPRSSENLVGCGIVYDSSFSMRCHDSVSLKRCLEVDMGRDCSDCYYCHNVEGLQNAIFCFNTKSLRNAVGNAEIGKERFAEVKKMLQEYLLERLEKRKDAELSIFNVGCGGK